MSPHPSPHVSDSNRKGGKERRASLRLRGSFMDSLRPYRLFSSSFSPFVKRIAYFGSKVLATLKLNMPLDSAIVTLKGNLTF